MISFDLVVISDRGHTPGCIVDLVGVPMTLEKAGARILWKLGVAPGITVCMTLAGTGLLVLLSSGITLL